MGLEWVTARYRSQSLVPWDREEIDRRMHIAFNKWLQGLHELEQPPT